MAIEPLADLSDLSIPQLYAVYLAIARSDHQWRVHAAYGDVTPRLGHCELRPVTFEQFKNRIQQAKSMAHGESLLRQRLARQAAAYRVDIDAELASIRQVA